MRQNSKYGSVVSLVGAPATSLDDARGSTLVVLYWIVVLTDPRSNGPWCLFVNVPTTDDRRQIPKKISWNFLQYLRRIFMAALRPNIRYTCVNSSLQ